jgi:hypothetical protein
MPPTNANPGAGGARVSNNFQKTADCNSRNRNPAQSNPAGSAVVIPFPKRHRFVVVTPAEGAWLVTWRGCGWLHGSLNDALADAAQIATAHGVAVAVIRRRA